MRRTQKQGMDVSGETRRVLARRRLIAAGLAVACALALGACDSPTSPTPPQVPAPATPTPEPAAPATPAPTPEPTPAPAPQPTPAPTPEPAPAPAPNTHPVAVCSFFPWEIAAGESTDLHASIGDAENQPLVWSVTMAKAGGGTVTPSSGGPIYTHVGPLTSFKSSAATTATATLTVTDSRGASTRALCQVTVK